jgi:DDE superfamily endonuclease
MDELDEFMLLILLIKVQQQLQQKKHTRYKKNFLRSLCLQEKRRRQRFIPRIALALPSGSAWNALYESGNDQALITFTGCDFSTFKYIYELFTPVYNEYSPFVSDDGKIFKINPKMGRPRLIGARDCLGLCLGWTRTRGSWTSLQMIFGLSSTSLSMYLRFGRRILILVLQNNPLAWIKIPSDDKIAEYQLAIKQRHPLLSDVWCTMDGLKLYLQQSGNNTTQNNFFNGWQHDHFVTSVICFCPDGTIPICYYNVCGTLHDSKIAEMGGIYNKLQHVYDRTGAKCTVDSAFAMKEYPCLIKSKQMPNLEQESRAAYREAMAINAEATSMRQSAEWGMRALQSSFPRLKDRFIFEKRGERRLILKMILLLYNIRSRLVGINQIKNVYMTSLEQNADELFNA